MQTILGSGGVIGLELAHNLTRFTDRVRLVSRNPKRVNTGDEIVSADLLNAEQALAAVRGSEVVYLVAGLPYRTATWQQQWPVIMRNVINACIRHKAKLVFFDNVYAYGRVSGWMTENTLIRPVSGKGQVRAALAAMITDEIQKGNLQAIIARSADFYGPIATFGFANTLVFDGFIKGKKAQWLINDRVRHSFTYTPDAGKATAILGNTEKAYNQVWHLPTDKNALTGKEFIEKAALAFNVEPRYRVISGWMVRMAGLFNTTIRENVEMLYQYDADYLFDSSKFDRAFGLKATTYDQGIREAVLSMK